MPVKWKLAKLDRDIAPPSVLPTLLSAMKNINLIVQAFKYRIFLLSPKFRPSSAGKRDRVMISAALLGLVNGITECGKVLG